MHLADWVVILCYMMLVIGIGLKLSRRAARSADDYLVAGRKLRWWVIGLSDVASDAGSDHLWLMMFFSGAFMAYFKVYWVVWAISLPLAVLWSRYWRRLALLSPWQIFEVRYGGKAAGRFRGFTALYAATVSSVIFLAYVLMAFSQVMAPFFPWDTDTVLLLFGGASVIYTSLSGLLGVTYSDVPQFLLLMAGRICLAIIVISATGGIVEVLDTVELVRGEGFLKPYPPSTSAVHGDYLLDPGSLFALFLAGLFGISSTQSSAVQRSLAAKTELDAALGQMFNALLTLVIRILPLILVGLVAVATYQQGEIDPVNIWADMVTEHAGPGLLGLLLVGMIAGSMSSIDTMLNFLTAGLFNDFYRRHLRPNATAKEQIRFCRFATLLVTAMAVLWAKVLIGAIDNDWIQFINTVIGVFILPLAVLRWVWWRINIWGEIVGYVGSVPLGYLVWFVFDFKSAPYWQAFSVLFILGWGLILMTTMFTKPESKEVLERFYQKVRPPGFWGPVKSHQDTELTRAHQKEVRLDLASALIGVVFCLTVVTTMTSVFARAWPLAAALGLLTLISGAGFIWFTLQGEKLRSERGVGS